MEVEKQKKQKSIVWDHYTKETTEIVVCIHCKSSFKFNSTTTHLLRHLKLEHNNKLGTNQLQLDSETLKFTKLSTSRTKQIHYAIAKFISRGMLPYSIVEQKSFQDLLKILEPRYNAPTRWQMTNNIIPELYSFQKSLLQKSINKAKSISITLDFWSNTQAKSYLSLTAHWINDEFEINNHVLQTKESLESHTGLHISEIVDDILKGYEIDPRKYLLKTAATDKAANNVNCFHSYLTEWDHFICFAHTLHNNIMRCYSVPSCEQVILKVRSISKLFRVSAKMSNNLIEKQKQLNIRIKRLKIDVCTRWNSTLVMLERFQENQKAIILALIDSKKELTNYQINDDEWSLISDMILILKPYESITTYISQEKNIVCSAVLPIIQNIKSILQIQNTDSPNIQAIKQVLIFDFDIRIRQYNQVMDLLNVVTFLDPRFQTKYFTTKENDQNSAKAYLKSFHAEKISQQMIDESTLIDNNNNNEQQISYLSRVFGNLLLNKNEQEDVNKLDQELSCYEKETIQISYDPLIWWNQNSLKYQQLSKLAQIFLSLQVTSIPCERVFSKAGLINNDLRKSLISKNLDELIFLSSNNEQQHK